MKWLKNCNNFVDWEAPPEAGDVVVGPQVGSLFNPPSASAVGYFVFSDRNEESVVCVNTFNLESISHPSFLFLSLLFNSKNW